LLFNSGVFDKFEGLSQERKGEIAIMSRKDFIIQDACFKDGFLTVIMKSGKTFNVHVLEIPALKDLTEDQIKKFEIQLDGGVLHWEEFDIDLEAGSFMSLTDPSYRAFQEREKVFFYRNYGHAIQKTRINHALKTNQIAGLTSGRVVAIEGGSIPTVDELRIFAKAHYQETNDYLSEVAENFVEPPKMSKKMKKFLQGLHKLCRKFDANIFSIYEDYLGISIENDKGPTVESDGINKTTEEWHYFLR